MVKLKEPFGYTDIYIFSEPDKDRNNAFYFTEYSHEWRYAKREEIIDFLEYPMDIPGVWGGKDPEVAKQEFADMVESSIRGCEGDVTISMGFRDYRINVQKTRLRNRDFNQRYIVGQIYEFDSDDRMTDKECPKCQHVLVDNKEWGSDTINGSYCSNCEYQDQKYEQHLNAEKEEWQSLRNGPSPSFMQSGLSMEEFAKEANISIDRENVWDRPCARCGGNLTPDKWGYHGGYASIKCKCDGCDNIPGTGVPFSKEKKEEWGAIVIKLGVKKDE